MKRVRAVALLLPAILLVCALGCTSAFGRDSRFEVIQITKDSIDYAVDPHVSDNRVVWDMAGEIFTWTPDAGTYQITNSDLLDCMPQVSGDRVVWCGDADLNNDKYYDIFTWTPSEGVVRLTEDDYWEAQVQVSGDRVVWERGDGNDYEVLTWTPDEGVVQLTRNEYKDRWPQVSGDRVVWRGYGGSDSGDDYEIFTWTPTQGILQLTDNDADDWMPRVYGDRVVWIGGGGKVFTWTAGAGQTILIGNSSVYEARDSSYEDIVGAGPQVSGDRVVWEDGNIFTWTPATGAVQISHERRRYAYYPQVSGNRVIWKVLGRSEEGVDDRLFIWTADSESGRSILQITDNDTWNDSPKISGDRVVWMGYDGNNYEIFTTACSMPRTDRPVQRTAEPPLTG